MKRLHDTTIAAISVTLIVAVCFLGFSPQRAHAAPPTSPYAPGETLSPACTPGTTNCTVRPYALAGANSDITSLSGLLTPLSIGQGGTGLNVAPGLGQFLLGNGAGGFSLVSTSTLGLVSGVAWGAITGNLTDQADVVSALGQKLSLTSWYATTTDALAEGTNRLYFTTSRVGTYLDGISKGYFFSTTSAASWLTGQTTDNLAEGVKKYYNTNLLAADLAATTTDALAEGVSRLYFTAARTQTVLDGISKGYFFSTTSAGNWLANQTTDLLAEGSTKKYYSTNLFARDLAGTTTDAVAEGTNRLYFTTSRVLSYLDTITKGYFFSTTSVSTWFSEKTTDDLAEGVNKYYSDLRVASYISGSSTIPHAAGGVLGNVLSWTGSAWASVATSTLGIAVSDLVGTLGVTKGGTGATTISAARSNLGLAIGSDVQGFDQELSALAGLTSAADKLPYFSGSGAASTADLSSFGRTLLDDTSATVARGTLLAAGSGANTDITSLGGLTTALSVAQGGTGLVSAQLGSLLMGNGTSGFATTTVGGAGQILSYLNGIPTWVSTTPEVRNLRGAYFRGE